MTNWQDKYKDLEVGQVAWYWHKTHTLSDYSFWSPVKVYFGADSSVLFAYNSSNTPVVVSEYFPNGPKCLNPDEMIETTKKLIDTDEVVKEKSMYEIGREKALEAKKKKYPLDIPPGFDPDIDSLYGGSKKK